MEESGVRKVACYVLDISYAKTQRLGYTEL
jgi:hypothetical protein